MLPAWLTFGGILVLVGGILILVGFLVALIGNASYATSSSANYFNSMAVYDALVGVGIFLAFLGWLFHQMSRHHQMGH
jgi:uncharacterized membrane protein